jgi:hypothetical protein
MTSTQLTPNIALRNTIEQFLATNAQPATPVTPPAPPAHVDIDLEVNTTQNGSDILAHVGVVPQAYGDRLPVGLSLTLDISGSMGEEASVKNDQVEIVGYSRLDLVKHSVNTIINSLKDNDVLAISAFTTGARQVLPPMKMNSFGRNLALSCVDSLRPEANTNLWSGLHMALEATKHDLFKGVNKHVLVLTDGESNQDPPRGIIPTYENYIRDNHCDVNVHAFGYGYNLDSKLLVSIASISNGTYAYIPDCTMVGTVFINFLSYVMSTISCNNKIKIVPGDGTIIQHVYGYSNQPSEINLGNLQFGQSRDLVIKIKPGSVKPYLTVSLTANGETKHKELNDVVVDRSDKILLQLARLRFVEVLQAGGTLDTNLHSVLALYDELSTYGLGESVVGLLTDLKSADKYEGQVSKAFSSLTFFEKWGRYYIPSIRRANFLQYCNNFKDKSVQNYGGRLFRELQDYVNDIFCKLVPPAPSLIQRYTSPTTGRVSANVPTTSLVSLSSSSIGCFGGFGLIDTPSGKRYVKDIQEGDYVSTPSGQARVVCVIRSRLQNDSCDLVKINDLLITPWHPIRVNGKWYFPKEYSPDTYDEYVCEYVYDYVLDHGHIVTINGIECVTLAHGFEGDVIEHPYFGSVRVIEDLQKMPGWHNGHISINKSHFTYDDVTGLINGWIFDE